MENEIILDDFSEETETNMNMKTTNSKAIDLDAFSDVPESDRYDKITEKMNIPKGTVFTITEVKISKPLMTDKDGKDLAETNTKGNKYYKGKLEIRFKEQVEGQKIREFISGLYWSINKDTNELLSIPNVSKAATDLEDAFQSDLAKLRTRYCNFKKMDPKDVSDKMFLKGLIGMKVVTEVKKGKNPKANNREYIRLLITGFDK